MTATEKPRVLCVDDEQEVLESFQQNLRKHFAVTTAQSGAEAIDILRKEPSFSVIVSDMRMPGMDGAMFLARARQINHETTRILLTGYTDMDAAMSAINEGFIFRFLTKPCPADVLVNAIRHGVIQHNLMRKAAGEAISTPPPETHQKAQMEQLATLRTLARGVGHELNNITTVFESLLPHIHKRAEANLAPDPEYLSELSHVCKHLRAHGKHLLSLGTPRVSAPNESASILQTVGQTLRMLRLAGKTKEVSIQSTPVDPSLSLAVDETHLEQVLINLILNAMDALHGRSDGRIQIQITPQSSERVSVIVQDNGNGIPEDQLAKVFNPGFTTKKDGADAGLGLSIVKELIESYQGELSVSSQPGVGTAFTFDLPLASAN